MLEIFKRIQKIFNNEMEFKSEEFIKGFKECFTLFEIGFKKTPTYSALMELDKVQKELEKVSEQLVFERKRNEKSIASALITFNKELEIERKRNEMLIEIFDIKSINDNPNVKLLKYRTRIAVHQLLFSTEIDNEEKINQLKAIMVNWNQ